MPADEICQWVEHLRTRSGYDIKRLLKYWHTHTPSVQGTWTPFTNKDTRLNIERFPSEEFGRFRSRETSSTERLLELVRAQEGKNLVLEAEDDGTAL